MAVLVLCTAITGGASSALFASGCGTSPAIAVVQISPGDKSSPVSGDAVKTRRGSQEAYNGMRGGYYVIRSADDWHNAWPGAKEPAFPATLDTTHSMLLLAVAERKDSTELRIQKVIETGDHIHVWVREVFAGDKCTSKLDRAPSDAVVTARIDKPVRFYVEGERGESCGDAPSVAVNCRLNDTPAWLPKIIAQPGDSVECEMSSASRGRFAVVDSVLMFADLPGGSTSKLAYTKGSGRGGFAVDVFGAYTVRAEALDEAGRRSQVTATIEALPPKTRDVLVQLVWTNFDVSDDPDTFPRVKMRAIEETLDAKNKPVQSECSSDNPRPELCEVKTRSAYTHMKLKASDKRIPLEIAYLDERIEKGPLACIQLYFDGARSAEICDPKHRPTGERWLAGVVDMSSGRLLDWAAAPAVSDAGLDAAPAKPGPMK